MTQENPQISYPQELGFIEEISSVLVLAIPLSLVQLSQAAISAVDAVMMGLMGSQVLAAGALGASSSYTIFVIGQGLIRPLNVLVAEAFSENQPEKVGRITTQGLWLVLMISVPMFVLLWNLPSIFLWCGLDQSMVSIAQAYLHACVWGFPAALGIAMLGNLTSALNYPQLVTIILFFGAILNGFADYALIFGKWGFPALGVAGIGWASTLIVWCEMVAATIVISLYQPLKQYRIFRDLNQFDRKITKEIFLTGWPLGLQYGADIGLFAAVAVLIGRMGADKLAANEIAFQTTEILFIIPAGIKSALMTRVGQLSGERNFDRLPRVAKTGVFLTFVFVSTVGLGLYLFKDFVIGIYLDPNSAENIESVVIAQKLLPVAAVLQFFFSLHLTVNGLLYGLKDTRTSMWINLGSYWFVGGGVGCLLGFILKQEVTGIWWGLSLGFTVSFLLLSIRFYYLMAHIKDYKLTD